MTGAQSSGPWAGHRVGEGWTASGNALAGAHVVDAMAEALEGSADETLSERLVRSLEAGRAAGGQQDPRTKEPITELSSVLRVFDGEHALFPPSISASTTTRWRCHGCGRCTTTPNPSASTTRPWSTIPTRWCRTCSEGASTTRWRTSARSAIPSHSRLIDVATGALPSGHGCCRVDRTEEGHQDRRGEGPARRPPGDRGQGRSIGRSRPSVAIACCSTTVWLSHRSPSRISSSRTTGRVTKPTVRSVKRPLQQPSRRLPRSLPQGRPRRVQHPRSTIDSLRCSLAPRLPARRKAPELLSVLAPRS